MRTCAGLEVYLSSFLDGEDLGESAGAAQAVRAHVEACTACRRKLTVWGRVSQQVREIAEEVPATLVDGIRRRLAEEAPARRDTNRVRRLAVAALTAAGLLWGAVLLGAGSSGAVLPGTAKDQALRLTDLVSSAGLSPTEREILYGAPLDDDAWMVVVLSGGAPR